MTQTLKLVKTSTFALCASFLVMSCNSGNTNSETTATDSNEVAAPAANDASTQTTADTANKLTDPEIASVALTADKIDIEYAQIAKEKSKNAEVLQFASTMAKDHQSVNDQAVALATKLGVTPQDNQLTQSLLQGAESTKAMLNSKSGAEFDKAYIDNEVAYHKAAIDIVENTLIPDASNDQLKSLLQTALPIFKQHLEHAEMIQKNLK